VKPVLTTYDVRRIVRLCGFDRRITGVSTREHGARRIYWLASESRDYVLSINLTVSPTT